jgi:hypothetical protein
MALCASPIHLTIPVVRSPMQWRVLAALVLASIGASASEATSGSEPDGDDDPIADTRMTLPASPRFERVGVPPLGLQRICDLQVFDGALYMAHANQPLGTDGATITKYDPDAKRPFSVAFDWNRPGEPTAGGGAGQGFLRVHAFDGRLWVPDADPPYGGFGRSSVGAEGYVFVSDTSGKFARAQSPGHLPPRAPDVVADKPGAALVPRAYHVLDAIRFRGRMYASTGASPPGERAWHGHAPGALHGATPDAKRWEYEVAYPFPFDDGVTRLTFLVRFRGRLYAGVEGGAADYVYVTPRGSSSQSQGPASVLEQRDLHAVQVTPTGGSITLRWYADRGKLYWIAWSGGRTVLRVSEDGDSWREVTLPPDAGMPSDITRAGSDLLVLAERALVRLGTNEIVSRVEGKKSPFEVTDGYCAAPLAVFRGVLYAGGQRGGALYKLAP